MKASRAVSGPRWLLTAIGCSSATLIAPARVSWAVFAWSAGRGPKDFTLGLVGAAVPPAAAIAPGHPDLATPVEIASGVTAAAAQGIYSMVHAMFGRPQLQVSKLVISGLELQRLADAGCDEAGRELDRLLSEPATPEA